MDFRELSEHPSLQVNTPAGMGSFFVPWSPMETVPGPAGMVR